MLNHITVRVHDFKKAKAFYSAALKPLGYTLVKKDKGNLEDLTAGFATEDVEGHRDFWIKEEPGHVGGVSFSCLAFTSTSKEMVNAFYAAAIGAGGSDNGAPGYRPEYHPGYYAAFVFDPDGNNIEAVFDDLVSTAE